MIGDMLAAMIGLALFVALLKEYLQHRLKHLLIFGLSLLAFSISFGLLFLAQASYFFEPIRLTGAALSLFNYFIIAHALLAVFGLIECYAEKNRIFWYSISGLVGAAVAILSRAPDCRAVLTYGLVLCDSAVLSLAAVMFAAFSGMAVLVSVAGWSGFRGRAHKELHRPDILMARAGVVGLVALSLVSAAILLKEGGYFAAGFIPLLAYVILLFLGVVAKKSADQEIAAHPTHFISRSLLLKASLQTVTIFGLMVLIISGVVIIFFTRTLHDIRSDGVQRGAQLLSQDFSERQDALLQETALAASQMASLEALAGGGTTESVAELEKIYILRGERVAIRIVDAQGQVLFSNLALSEVGSRLTSSRDIVDRALIGLRVAVLEPDGLFGRMALRAAVPLIFDDGSQGALVASTLYSPNHLSGYLSAYQDFGLISEGGEVFMLAGRMPEEQEIEGIRKMIDSPSAAPANLSDGSLLSVRRINASDGAAQGIVYVLSDVTEMGKELMRIFVAILVMNMLALLIMTMMVLWAMGLLLRPIKELRAAAQAAEKGDYSLRSRYAAHDELGDTAAAFNRMSATIADRTSRLRQALQEQTRFLSYTAHELMTPLNILHWSIDMLRFGDAGRLNKNQLELMEQMNQTNRRLRGLVQNLMETSKIEQGQIALKCAFVSMEDIIDEAAGSLAIKAREKEIDLRWRRPEPSLPKVYGDSARLVQIVLNLLTNAIKYTDRKGRVVVTAQAAKESGPGGPKGKYVQVAVEDNGRGIPEDEQDGRVFSRFFRASNVARTDIEGTGLGLYIARKLIEAQGGRIWFISKEGAGSTFYFTIPAENKEEDKPHRPDEARARRPRRSR